MVASDIRTVGVVGLGNMGLPMAARLVAQGFAVIGHDREPARVAQAVAAGALAAADAASVLRACDAAVLSLPNGDAVAAVALDPAGLPARDDRRVLVLDTSTCDPGTTRRVARALAAAGHGHLDAPVSGGPAGAASGTLAMMLGGDAADVASAAPVTAALAARVVHVGASGAGNVAKLVNNLLVAAHLVTNREALRLAVAAGVDPESVLAVVNGATGRSAVSEAMIPRWVLPGTFDSGFSAGLMRKDVRLALDLAREAGVALPLAEEVARRWAASGLADADDFTRMASLHDT